MSDAQVRPEGDPSYSYRPALLGAAHEFHLTPPALVWRVGGHSRHIAYRDIRSVRLSFRPASTQPQRFIAEIWPEQGPKLTIASTSWRSMMDLARQDAAYREFLVALHRNIAAAGSGTQFVGGAAPYLYWPGLMFFLAVAFGLAALTVRGLQAQEWAGAAFVAGLFALFLWQIGGYFRRNRPGRYRADALPPDLLPRG